MNVIKKIWLSEKATDLHKDNQYVFLVEDSIGKNEIKKAIGRKYGVTVQALNVIRQTGKLKKIGRNIGRRPGFKKAIATLRPGEKIDIS